jgi:hypothetical protein
LRTPDINNHVYWNLDLVGMALLNPGPYFFKKAGKRLARLTLIILNSKKE